MADVKPKVPWWFSVISDIIPGVCCLIHHEPKFHGTETQSSVHACLYVGTDEAICLSPANRLLGSQFCPFSSLRGHAVDNSWKMGASSKGNHHVHPHPTTHPSSLRCQYEPLWTHELPSMIMANNCRFVNGHAQRNDSPITLYFF